MKSVRKDYAVTMSHVFSDGTIVVCKYGTELEETDADPSELFDKAAEATKQDIKIQVKRDPMAKAVFEAVKNAIKKEKKVAAAQKEFNED